MRYPPTSASAHLGTIKWATIALALVAASISIVALGLRAFS
jgi:hypothetical protein